MRVLRILTDAVEKVGSTLPERNNGIKTNNILNRCCVFASSLESMLLGKAPKIFFQHGVIPGSSQTTAQGISSPGIYEATLM
jgi:hypothetical protein